MKVLQVSKYFPPVLGGIETVARELAEGLNLAGVTTAVLCSHQHWRGVEDRADSGYPVVRSGRWGVLLSTAIAPGMPWTLARLCADADLVHLHMPDPMAAAAFRLVDPRVRLVVHWHSDVIRQRRALRLYEPLQRWLLRRADAVIATSPPYAEASPALRDWRGKLTVIPIGISDNRGLASSTGAAALRQRFGGRRIVFALGRMTYYKGFDVLIDAAAALPDDCVVAIGGDGELLAPFRERLAARGLAGKVALLGQLADAELPTWFEACDVFCMPSTVRAEAYGVAIVEAMMMGKPTVATDIAGSGVPWVNQHARTGLNVPAGNVSALAAALNRLLADADARRTMGAAARERYETTFRAGRMVDLTRELYGRLLPAAA